MDGVLIVDKPAGPTSHDVVSIVKRTIGAKKVGHLGTLDPPASGVLPLAIDGATKKATALAGDEKVYEFELCLGAETDTDDDAGAVIDEAPIPADAEMLLRGIIPTFEGEIQQRPPRYSAIKVGGQRAYALARKGIAFELEARPVRIESMELVRFGLPRVSFRVSCSSGTYVRSLCRDLARGIGCRGHASGIRRMRSGAYTIDRAVALDALVKDPEAWRKAFIPLE